MKPIKKGLISNPGLFNHPPKYETRKKGLAFFKPLELRERLGSTWAASGICQRRSQTGQGCPPG